MFELDLTQPIEISHSVSNDPFDKHEGDRRTELKNFNRTIHYRGLEIKRNANVPCGAEGYWEVPKLKWFGKGGLHEGFLTVSILQSKEAIDRYYDLNF
jgi:hypothetical protein